MESPTGETAIRCEGLTKCYHVYDAPADRLRQAVVPRVRRWLGRPARQYYREFWALRDVSFDVARGETVGIIGRNGSGKSTLLQLACGTLTPTGGCVDIAGRVAALLELGSGFNPEFTGRENVFMNAAILGLGAAQTRERLDDILAFAEIGDYIDQPVKTYSSGMVVRLAFAVIAHVDADILVIDEALSVGDVFFVQKCMRFLHGFMRRGTVLFVSHDTAAVLSLCRKVVWLDRGVVRAIGDPREVVAAYNRSFYAAQQSVAGVTAAVTAAPPPPADYRDRRLDFVNTTELRNDIRIPPFDPPTAGYGDGAAVITTVRLTDADGAPLAWTVGGELVSLEIVCDVYRQIDNPIIGFFVNDRTGQRLFGDNTFLSTLDAPKPAGPGQRLTATFAFRLPILAKGDYTVTVAVASGSQAEHVQHHWLDDALSLQSQTTSVWTGLVGLPMLRVDLEVSGASGGALAAPAAPETELP